MSRALALSIARRRSRVLPAADESKPRDVSNPSETSKTALFPFQLASNRRSASITSTYGLKDDAAVLAVTPLHGAKPGRRIHADVVSAAKTGAVAIKLWEACPPEAAPPGAEKSWHPCGGARSNAFKAFSEKIKQQLHPETPR